jgi:putative FmdB family regulatory protein
MPTYQYACPDCGLEFERVQKFTDDPVKKCPKCSKRKVYRVVSKVAVSFKGSGWYINDSKRSVTSGNGKDEAKEQETKTEEKAVETTAESKETKETKDATAAETPAKESATDKKADGKSDKPDKPDKTEKKPAKKKAE